MKLEEIGEFGLIERVSRKIKLDSSIIKGIGDDAAVIKWKKDKHLLFASDMIIEGVHFNLKKSTPFKIGWKALGVNISDIAAMGGVPLYATISLGITKDMDFSFVDAIYSGLKSMARRFGVKLVGGDTNSSDKIIIDIAIIGEVRKDELALRSGAKPGDFIIVTGTLGGSIRGKHLTFMPRIKESQYLVKNFKINSMIDISDGLSGDLIKICRKSKLGARIYESLIPLSKDCRLVKDALYDGEDFELLFTVSEDTIDRLLKGFRRRFKTPLTPIGEIVKEKEKIQIINRYGINLPLKDKGFRHF